MYRRTDRIAHRLALAGMLAALLSLPCEAQVRASPGGLPPRDQWQKVPEILTALGAAPGQRIADVAAGDGYLTRHLSRAVGPAGRVLAVEIDSAALRKLAKLAHDSLPNMQVVTGTETDPCLDGPIDAAVVLDSYHEFTQYKPMLAAIKGALRPGGLLVIVDNAPFHAFPDERDFQASHHSLDPKFAEGELRAAGFEIATRNDDFIGEPYAQWLIVARRPAR
jgi:predicted methyltransferase